MKDVSDFLAGVEPTRAQLCRLAGLLQARGTDAEAADEPGVTLQHPEAALVVRTLQIVSALLGEMAVMIDNHRTELQMRDMQDRLTETTRPKLVLQ